MSKVFNGMLHLDCNEMSERYGDSAQSWRRQARLKKVPAIYYRRKWYFEPEKAFKASVTSNDYAGENVENANEQGAEDGILAGLE